MHKKVKLIFSEGLDVIVEGHNSDNRNNKFNKNKNVKYLIRLPLWHALNLSNNKCVIFMLKIKYN